MPLAPDPFIDELWGIANQVPMIQHPWFAGIVDHRWTREQIIQGYWADGSVHLRWPAIGGHYSADGRFPAWVVNVDESAIMAGGGRILFANDPKVRRAGPPARLVMLAVVLLIVLVLLLLPPTRDALGALAADLFNR